MPHLSIEYSKGVETQADIPALCSKLLSTVHGTGFFELGAIRVRAFRADASAVADEHPRNNFLDMSFRIGTGRNLEVKKQIGEAILSTAADHLQDLTASPYFALSLEIREIDSELSWRKNSIHSRLRDQGTV